MNLLKQDIEKPNPTTPRSVSTAQQNINMNDEHLTQEQPSVNNEENLSVLEENTHPLDSTSQQNIFINQQPNLEDNSHSEEPDEDEEILDCDDIVMFNNWDDVRSESLAY